MCFSATASFGASAAILVVTIIAFRKSVTRTGYIVACIPLFFSIQQALEGLLWVALQHPEYRRWGFAASYGFLFFAQVVWPLLIPSLVWLLERRGAKKNVLAVFWIIGLCTGLYFLWCLVRYTVVPSISGMHIHYELNFPGYNKYLLTSSYLLATLIPPLISRVKPLRWFGLLLFVSLAVTAIFYKGYLISVWCVFAAALSAEALLIILYLNRIGRRGQKSGAEIAERPT